ncbi:Predicted DNA-binding protein, MmcQ/YjbR family [Fictibacillus enclensis]|uniref:Phosphoribosylglycinamide formyltransferase n=1 Tax=Fictibacillus enclensis TaxID=1017270 RepID=A0A0V8J775_9BACL|nr:MmcQ/YjbR family DNA-binding protein [Fictibacillus enclensis]KSU83031.1 phosphoribosylglycinamide formyltransferase [Fictibacillus enclensis]SCC08950.1 Predicted DNA-binding protein, MmcQ/YjbR family [Fictibacillus enclensis]
MSVHKKVQSESGLRMLENVREICTLFPETVEHIDGFGHTSFRVREKPFIIMGENEHGTSLAIKTLPETQEILLQEERFFRPAYIGHHGWTSIYNSEEINWEEIRGLIYEAYCRTAPKRLIKMIQEDH